MGHDLIDDTERYNICFDSVFKKENILLNKKFDNWRSVIKKGVEILRENGSVFSGYEKKLLYSVERYGSYLTIYKNVCFAYTKDKTEVIKSDVVFIELDEELIFPGEEKIDKIFIVSAISEKEYLIIAEKVLDMLNENNLKEVINKKINIGG